MNDIRPALSSLVDDEPELNLSLDTVLAAGKTEHRHRRVRRISAIGLPALALGAAAVILPLSSSGGTAPASPLPSVAAGGSHGQAKPALTGGGPQLVSYASVLASLESGTKPVLGPLEEKLSTAVREQSPSNYAFTFNGPDTGNGTLQGTVNNGKGSAGVYFSVNPSAPYRDQYPCTNRTTTYGGECTTFTIDNGEAEQVIYPASQDNGFQAIEITFKFDDGSYIVASASNAVLGEKVVGTDGSEAQITRLTDSDLLYSRDQLTVIAKAMYDASHS